MRKSIIALLAVAVTLASCAKRETLPQGVRGEVQFTTNIQSYAVKATDTAFENGDKIGIFAGAPINKNNVEGTISGTSVTMADPIHWVEGDNGVVEFIGYYPYASGMSKQGSFAVKADQRKAADYTASDLMIAKVSSAPSDNAVVLPFKHALSKVVLNITNEVAGTTINEVRFTEVALSANVDLATATISDVAAEKAAIRANNVSAGQYQLVVIPQSASPKVLVEVSDGNTYTFSLAQAFSFKSGKKVTANITVSESAPIVFSFEVSDWDVEEEALEFENTAVDPTGGWAVYGSWDEWAEGIAMTRTSEDEAEVEVWEADITYAEGDEFKLRNGDIWAGMKEGWTYYGTGEFEDGYLDATEAGINIVLEGAGEYHLVFSWPSCRFVVTKSGDEPEPQPGEIWEVMGSWNEWAEGIAMTKTSEEEAEVEVWEADITYAEGDEFKLRSGDIWAGMKAGWEYYGTGEFEDGYLDASNEAINIVLQGAGEYHLVFSWPTCRFVVTKSGDEPQPEDDVWTVIGSWDEWAEDIDMTKNEDGIWEADITYAVGDEFKLRANGDWVKSAGMKEGWTVYALGEFEDAFLEADSSNNIKLAAAGEYHLSFNPETYRFIVTGDPEPIPDTATLTLNVYNEANWDLKLWAWQGSNNLCGEWPGMAPSATDVVVNNNTYKSFTLNVASGVAINYLLSNNGTPQTVDLSLDGIQVEETVYVWLKSTGIVEVIEDPATFVPGEPDPTITLTINVYNSTNWSELALYCWNDVSPWPNYSGAWPGMAPAATDVVENNFTFKSFVLEGIPAGVDTVKYILNNNNNGSQTGNLSLAAMNADTTLFVELKAEGEGFTATVIDPNNFTPSN